MATSVELTTKPEGILTCQYDATLQRHAIPDGILYGIDPEQISVTSSSVSFGDGGLICCCGRLLYINNDTTVEYTEGVSNYIILRVKNNDAELDESLTIDDLTGLVKDDINMKDIDGVYEVPIVKINSSSSVSLILPKVGFGGIYYGTEDPDDSYPYQDGSIYIKYSES